MKGAAQLFAETLAKIRNQGGADIDLRIGDRIARVVESIAGFGTNRELHTLGQARPGLA